jgi:hypothetical protein
MFTAPHEDADIQMHRQTLEVARSFPPKLTELLGLM